jgi:hypothetical protein
LDAWATLLATAVGLAGLLPAVGFVCACSPKPPSAVVENVPPKKSSRTLVVKASARFTEVGRYPAGTTVSLSVRGGKWRAGPKAPEVDAEGEPGALCLGDEQHQCIGGNGVSPRMALIVLMTPCPIEQDGCFVFGREAVGHGLQVTVPRDGHLYLAPNERVDEVDDDDGAIEVEVSP